MSHNSLTHHASHNNNNNNGLTSQKIIIPNINSSDREERIAARRARIAIRLEQKNKNLNSSSMGSLLVVEVDNPKPGTGEKALLQIKESKKVSVLYTIDYIKR